MSLVRVLAGVFFLAVLIGYTMHHANFVLGRSLLFAFPGWEVTYRSAWPLPGGGVKASDVKFVSPDGEAAGSVTFASVRVEVPFLQYYRSGFSRARGALLDSIRDLHLEFGGGHGDLDYPFTHELALFGNFSAAPFEAEGCMEDSAWIEKEIADMGLEARGIDLVMDYHLTDATLVKQQNLGTPGVGRVEFRREMIKHDDFPLFSLIETGRSEVASDEWHVKDEGFVAARNQHCAAKDKVTPDVFVQRHIDSARRLLEVVGLAALPEVEQGYRSYAAAGGSFDVVIRYDPPVGGPLYSATDLSTWLPRMRGTVGAGGKTLPLALLPATVRPLPDGDDADSTYALIVRENGAGTEADAAPSVPVPAPAGIAAAAATARAPSAEPVSIPARAAAVVAAAPPAVMAPVPAVAASVEAPRQDAADEPPPQALTKYSQLAGYVGRDLTVYQQGREPVRVRILRVGDAGSILVRRSMVGGNVEFLLDRTRFDHAEE